MATIVMRGKKIPLCNLPAQDVGRILSVIEYIATYSTIFTEKNLNWIEKESVFDIVKLDTKEIMGTCSIRNHGKDLSWASVAITIMKPEEHSMGYGTEAMKLLVKYGFEVLGVNVISLEVFDFNKRAIRSYEKAGFVKTGEIHKVAERDGKLCNLWVMEITREMWDESLGQDS